MSNCPRICIPFEQYTPELHELIGVYNTESECVAACQCAESSSSEIVTSSSSETISSSSEVVSSSSEVISSSSETISSSSEVVSSSSEVISSSSELSSSSEIISSSSAVVSSSSEVMSSSSEIVSSSSDVSSSSEVISSSSEVVSSSSEVISSSSELSSSSEIVSSSSEFSSDYSSSLSSSSESVSCGPCGPDSTGVCCVETTGVKNTQTNGWIIPPIISTNENDGSGSVLAVFKFEDSVNCCPGFTSSDSSSAAPITETVNAGTMWGSPPLLNRTTTVGTNGAPSYYGTFDQSGNAWEWNDTNLLAPDDIQHRNRAGGGASGAITSAQINGAVSTGRILPGETGELATLAGLRVGSFTNPLALNNFVPVNNLNNPANSTTLDQGSNTTVGAVAYAYFIGKYEVTNCEYVEFLNAKGQSDPSNILWYPDNFAGEVGMTRSGEDGSYVYATAPNMANKPAYALIWSQAARYCNWLHNGKGNGDTETGAYTLPSADKYTVAVTRNPGAQYFIPSGDEWYKAAYYDPTKDGVGGYWAYATRSNTVQNVSADEFGNGTAGETDYTCPAPAPIIARLGTPINNANYNGQANWNGITFGGNYTTVGSNGGPSAYGTYDQSGNIYEWNDLNGADPGESIDRGIRGGHYSSLDALRLSADYRAEQAATLGQFDTGFRVASAANALLLENFTTVGDAGNSPDDTGYGAVSDVFLIGIYPVTNCEYADFLNAVAAADPHQLYDERMGDPAERGGIDQTGTSGNFTYAAKTNLGNKPVNFVNWFRAARYCNWLHNRYDNPNTTETETGAYTLTGAFNAVARNPGARYHIPTENEWYKAAYYKGGSLDAGYWTYATQSDTAPDPVTANEVGDGSARVSEYECAEPSYSSSSSEEIISSSSSLILPSSSSTKCNSSTQSGKATCRVTFDEPKKVLVRISGNTERQDAPYDVSEIKITSESGDTCLRTFVNKKCQSGSYWTNCEDTPLDGEYEQCCSPLLSIEGLVSSGSWPEVPGSPPATAFFNGQYSKEEPFIAHYIHPNLTLECPKATIGGTSPCQIEPLYFKKTNSPCNYEPDHTYVTPSPLAAYLRLSALQRACPDPETGSSASSDGSSVPYGSWLYYADFVQVFLYEIFYVEKTETVSSISAPATPITPMADTVYKDESTQKYYYWSGASISGSEIIGSDPNGGFGWVEFPDYDETKVNWYARLSVTYALEFFDEYNDEFTPWGAVKVKSLEYFAKLACSDDGKPTGRIPPPPEESSSSGPSAEIPFSCDPETGESIDLPLNTEFPTLFFYKPGTAPGPTNPDGTKPPTTPAPAWCGSGGKTTGEPCATLGVECNGCEKSGAECGANNILARACISGTDDNLGCEMGYHDQCRIFTLPAGTYLINFITSTKDGLFHVGMEHAFHVEWYDASETVECPLPSSSSESSVSVASSASSASADPAAIPLFDKTSWASIVPEPYKTYLDAAADRWMQHAAFDPTVAAAIKSQLGGGWNGTTLASYTPFFNTLDGENWSGTLAAVGAGGWADLITSGPGVKFNMTSFHLYINTAWSTTTNSPNPLTSSQWIDILTHELGHALGIGIFWDQSFQTAGAVPPASGFLDGTAYAQAQTAYNQITGLTRTQIPLEDGGQAGTQSAHWENTSRTTSYPGGGGVSWPGFFNELMVGFFDTNDPTYAFKLSDMSLNILEDFGYVKVGPGEGDPTLVQWLPLTEAGSGIVKLNCCSLAPDTGKHVATIYLESPPF